ncbi:hypothetical protein [Bacillus sp. V33-4]|nr:hypothetical protein [Bacillus sp. V33-4]PLR86658.1 hypothetical protein CVD23_05845 [Bacillus sp. V33-4]
MNKQKLIDVLTPVLEAETIVKEQAQQNEKPSSTSHKGRTRTIEVFKDGQLVRTIEGLIETFKWANENAICDQGWVKHSLKTGTK